MDDVMLHPAIAAIVRAARGGRDTFVADRPVERGDVAGFADSAHFSRTFKSAAEGDALLAPVTKGAMRAAIFDSDDLDATFDAPVASGPEVLEDPRLNPGSVDFVAVGVVGVPGAVR